MCGSMVDIQSPAAEIRRGNKRKKEERRRNHRAKWSALLHRGRATIISLETRSQRVKFGKIGTLSGDGSISVCGSDRHLVIKAVENLMSST